MLYTYEEPRGILNDRALTTDKRTAREETLLSCHPERKRQGPAVAEVYTFRCSGC